MNERNADVSKTLTEKWKKGELPSGWYWVEGSRAEGIYAYTAEYLNNMYRPRNGEIIIEQVPSYEEWQEYKNANDSMFDTIKMLNKDNYKLEKENTKLKELLKELRKALQKETPALRVENAKLKTQVFLLKGLLYENRQKMFEAEKNYGFDDSIIDILTPQMDKIDKLLGDKTDEQKS